MHKNKTPVIKLEKISKHFLYKTTFKNTVLLRKKLSKTQVLKNISLSIFENELIGIYGPNGSGKSTLLKIIAGIINPSEGTVTTTKKVLPIIELGAGLHPDLSGLDNIYIYGNSLQIPKSHLNKNLKKIINFSELSKSINQPLSTYSSGMKARLAFSIAIYSNAPILLLDEILVVGDQEFQQKAIKKILTLKKSKTIVLVSHNLWQLISLCDQIIPLESGIQSHINSKTKNRLNKFLKIAIKKIQIPLTISSSSMNPTLKIGDKIVIKPISFAKIKTGDIVAFSFLNLPQPIIHRVVGINKSDDNPFLITKGDASSKLDPLPIERENILGKLDKIIT